MTNDNALNDIVANLFQPIRRDEPIHQKQNVCEQREERCHLDVIFHDGWEDGLDDLASEQVVTDGRHGHGSFSFACCLLVARCVPMAMAADAGGGILTDRRM